MGANVRLTQCLRAIAACFCVEVNITAIVHLTAINRPKCVVSAWSMLVGVGHFGPLPKPSHGSARRSLGSHHGPLGQPLGLYD